MEPRRSGPPPVARWSGFYVGGQAGYSSSMINFGTAASGDISFILRNTAIEQNQQISQWTVLGQRFPTSASFGGFVGYNVQFEDTIVGFEVNYNHLQPILDLVRFARPQLHRQHQSAGRASLPVRRQPHRIGLGQPQ